MEIGAITDIKIIPFKIDRADSEKRPIKNIKLTEYDRRVESSNFFFKNKIGLSIT